MEVLAGPRPAAVATSARMLPFMTRVQGVQPSMAGCAVSHNSPAGNKWLRRRAGLTAAAAQAVCERHSDSLSSQDEDPIDIPCTSVRELLRPEELLQGGGQSMLQLVAAWDSLAARLPQDAGTGPAAETLLRALKLVLAYATPEGTSRALSLAARLAELAGETPPLDADAIAAGLVAEAFRRGQAPPQQVLEQRLSPVVAHLLGDLRKVRALPSRVDLYDDEAAAALRELCLAFYDVRATAVEVVCRLHSLHLGRAAGLPPADLQVAALEALQIYAPMGHGLRLGSISAELEDFCFQTLFPESYARTAAWLREQTSANAATLVRCAAELRQRAEADPRFARRAAALHVHGRTKTLFSTLKKLLRLGNTARGGRARNEIYDLLGMRAVVVPRSDLPEGEAEAAATEACKVVEALAHALWPPVEGRSKDYIAVPKANGYQSLHSTVQLPHGDSDRPPVEATTVELQIRTQAMHELAEFGDAAHAAYKGGLDAVQVRHLHVWTQSLVQRSAATLGGDGEALSAAEGLFRHLDLDRDGRVSLAELQHAMRELRAGSGGDAAAATLLQLAEGNADGTVSLPQFLEFQRKVGLVHATSALDHVAANLLEAGAGAPPLSDAGSDDEAAPIMVPASSAAAPAINNALASSAMHTWGLPRHGSSRARAPLSTAFVERGGGGGSSSSYDDVISESPSSRHSSGSSSPNESSSSSSVQRPVMSAAVEDVQPRPGSSNAGEEHLLGTNHVGSGGGSSSSSSAGESPVLIAKPERPETWPSPGGMHGLMRMFQPAGSAEVEATWCLVPLPSTQHTVCDAAGQPLSAAGSACTVSLPHHGPCILGALPDSDCDLIVDFPTVSGRHARLEVVRRRATGRSHCTIVDLGSTNGTWVNRARLVQYKEVQLYPGDVVCLAEPGIAFEVRVGKSGTASSGPSSAGAAAADPGSPHAWQSSLAGEAAEGSGGPAVRAALHIAAALEAEAAGRGVFAPANGGDGVDVGDRARTLLGGGEYQAAYMLLLGGVMARPLLGGLWAQLAAVERQRARRREQGSTPGTVRAFSRAAVESFEAEADASARRLGLSRVFSSWALLEYDLRNDGPARILFQKALRNARAHPAGPAAASAAKLLFTWATREWKLGDAACATRLCGEALEVDAANPFALTLLANIQAEAGNVDAARDLFSRAVAAHPEHVTALQSWGRMEAGAGGDLGRARELFRRALRLDSRNAFVLQAWAVAEARGGFPNHARQLLERCTRADPACRAAWHAWGKLEDDLGSLPKARELYQTVLRLSPTSVETLSALGCLERRAGNLYEAESHLRAALRADPRHAPSLHELSLVMRLKGQEAQGHQFEKRARRANQERKARLAQVRAAGAPLRRQ